MEYLEIGWSDLSGLLSSTFIAVSLLLAAMFLAPSFTRFGVLVDGEAYQRSLKVAATVLVPVVAAQAFLSEFDDLGPAVQHRPETVELIGAASLSGLAVVVVTLVLAPAWILSSLVSDGRQRPIHGTHQGRYGVLAVSAPVILAVFVLVLLGVEPIPGETLFAESTAKSPLDAALHASSLLRITLGLSLLLSLVGLVATASRWEEALRLLKPGPVLVVGLGLLSAADLFESVDRFDPIPERSLALSVGFSAVSVLVTAYSFLLVGAVCGYRATMRSTGEDRSSSL